MYILLPLGLISLGWAIVFTSRPPTSESDYKLFFGVLAFLLLVFLDLRYGTYCILDETNFYRVSYFVFEKALLIGKIDRLILQPTYIFGGDANSLWITGDSDGKHITIQMTDMAYGRPALAEVVRTLLDANPHIKIDKDVDELLKNT
jgi:hypothetical protein